MANTTSGTATFDKTFAIDEIVEEAYQRIGIDQLDAYQIKSARRSINIMFQEWGNRGLHYWEIDETNIDLIEGQAEYHFLMNICWKRSLNIYEFLHDLDNVRSIPIP